DLRGHPEHRANRHVNGIAGRLRLHVPRAEASCGGLSFYTPSGDEKVRWNPQGFSQRLDLSDGEPPPPGEELGDARSPTNERGEIRFGQPGLVEHERDDALRRARFVERV